MNDWMTFYYAHPEPTRFVAEVRALAESGAFVQPERRIVLATFLSQVMAANRKHIDEWMTDLSDLEGEAREAVRVAAWLSNTREARLHLARVGADCALTKPASDILERPIDEPTVIDVLWAYYFATGDVRAVRRVISALEHVNDAGAAERFLESAQTPEDRTRACNDAVFERASWSLLSLMHQHPPLQVLCEELLAMDDLSANERAALAMTLERADPERWCVALDPVTRTASVHRRGSRGAA